MFPSLAHIALEILQTNFVKEYFQTFTCSNGAFEVLDTTE